MTTSGSNGAAERGSNASSSQQVVIVGAGQAGGDLAANLREFGFSGAITLIGNEDWYPYSRHPLSKAYLRGEKGEEDLLLRGKGTYERFDIDVKVGLQVETVDRHSKKITFGEGDQLAYDVLVLATGGSPRRLPDELLEAAPNVFYLRAIGQAEQLRARLKPGDRLTVIGGGYIGLEVAAVARRLGLEVTIVEREERLLARVTSEVTSSFFARIHREEGVVVHTGRSVVESVANANGLLTAVILDDGTPVETDLCLIGVGLEPNTALAQNAGIDVSDGIVVDSLFRTSDDSIFAIGDVARFPRGNEPGTVRLESIPNGTEQARALARTLVGEPSPYQAVPWFWSDQYDLKLQVVGLTGPGDTIVVRGVPERDRAISVFYLRNDVIQAAEVLSNPRDFAIARKLVGQRTVVSKENLADCSIPLKQLLG